MKSYMSFIAVAVLAATSYAQAGPPSPADQAQHRVSFLTTLLSLNAAQQQQALTIFKSEATSQSAVHDNMKTAHDSLDSAVKNNDQGAIDQAAAAIGQLAGQSVSIHAKAEAAFLQTLNPEQQTKLSQFESQRHPGPGAPGPVPFNGMFGGPPPGR